MKFWFWPLWAVDVVVASIAGYLFLSGVADRTMGSPNMASVFSMAPQFVILCVLTTVVGGSLELRARARTRQAIAVASILAIPTLFLLLFASVTSCR
ncbi:MAG: hypothetical protein LBQ09_06235 [Acidobacteriaceae bacterium]|nr:hypothetical protein [Acidobacteriaceae bacterium]